MTKVAPSKDELERQKLALEIQELQRRWWQRPVYLSILLPILLASLTVLAGILSGYFNRERTQLTQDIEALKAEKSQLIEKTRDLAIEKAATLKRLQEMNTWLDEMVAKYSTPTPTPSSN
jgi:hypothetical protein